MEDLLARFFGNLLGRVHGPLTFRLLLQPTTAALLAVRAGFQDARAGRPAFGWALVTDPAGRRKRLREGLRAVASVFLVAMLIDVVYQLLVFNWVYPLETVTVAAVLAFVPYVLIRGPANRIARLWLMRKPARAGDHEEHT